MFVYLDHNIVDRIDKGLGKEIESFLEINTFVPVISTASLGEIERGERPDRINANIQSLVEIGARLISEENSEIIFEPISADRIFELMSRKDELIVEIVRVINKAQFYLISSTSRSELEKIKEVIQEIETLIGSLDESYEKIARNLLVFIDLLNNLIIEGTPEKYNFVIDERSKQVANLEEINNLNPAELWKTIDGKLINSWGLSTFDLEGLSRKKQLHQVLLMLNVIGYWCDIIKNENRNLAFNYDCQHGIYGMWCYGILSADKRFLKRLKAAYHYLDIRTKVFLLSGNEIEEL